MDPEKDNSSIESKNCPRTVTPGKSVLGLLGQHVRLVTSTLNPLRLFSRIITRSFEGVSLSFAGSLEVKMLKDRSTPDPISSNTDHIQRIMSIERLEREIVEIRQKLDKLNHK